MQTKTFKLSDTEIIYITGGIDPTKTLALVEFLATLASASSAAWYLGICNNENDKFERTLCSLQAGTFVTCCVLVLKIFIH